MQTWHNNITKDLWKSRYDVSRQKPNVGGYWSRKSSSIWQSNSRITGWFQRCWGQRKALRDTSGLKWEDGVPVLHRKWMICFFNDSKAGLNMTQLSTAWKDNSPKLHERWRTVGEFVTGAASGGQSWAGSKRPGVLLHSILCQACLGGVLRR